MDGFSPSTPWGERSYPESLHRLGHHGAVDAAHLPVGLWEETVHRVWTTEGPSTRRQGYPPAVPRTRPVVPSFCLVLHSNVHSSATSIHISLLRVKDDTRCCQRGWGEPGTILGTQLGKTWGQLNCPVGEGCYVHSPGSFSTGSPQVQCGQKSGSELGGMGLSTVSTRPTTTTPRIELGDDRKAGGRLICG